MRIVRRPRAELLAERDELEAMMQAADARVYELAGPGLEVRLIDFPIVEDEISYVWTAYWSSPLGPHAGNPNVTIATAARGQLNSLRARLGLEDDYQVELAGRHVTLEGQSGVQEKALTVLHSQRAYVEFIDGDVVVILTVRSLEDLPAFEAIRPVRDLQPMIERWKAL